MFIVLEKLNYTVGGIINIVADWEGNTIYYETKAAAQAEADKCQDGQVVDIGD